MKKFLFLLLPFCVNAQIPEYYDGIDFTANNRDLQAELSDLVIATHRNKLTYTPGVWDALVVSDLDPENSNNVLLIYGFDDNSVAKNHRTRSKHERNTGGCGSCIGRWEREHVFPKSLASPPLKTSPAGPGTDAHNLRAVDREMNSSRSNLPYTDGRGNSAIIQGNGFYPGDEWIGDVARILMYMHIRYNQEGVQVTNANNVVWNSTNTFSPEMPDLFLKWNAMDPPSEYELVRNEVIYEAQGNRNPFIDNPYLATLTWGGDVAQNNWVELSTTNYIPEEISVNITPNPTSDIATIEVKNFKSANLYNISGALVKSDLKRTFSIAELPAGTYIVTIHLENGKIVTKKLIKK
ncbi:endonuclease [Faecalibacter sp. LW9]|uniref:endonuclease n=1 Tax=Faecalibacter sp. LW9 TaxID=3103144 RepID=UPI002AFF6560|nr:endonuclease [Faecalibacter sp. LW9]